MRQPALFALSFLIGCFSLLASAGEYNTTLNVGDSAPAWSELPGVDGKQHSLADLKEKEFVAIVFTCNSCPYAVDYEDRLIEFARKHAGDEGKVALVAINVNAVPEDSFSKMQERAKEKGFNFPYLYDESQKIAKAYGATRTPEFFLLDASRKVVYMGAMDDNADASKVKTNYLEQAIAEVRAGKKVDPAETLPVGCAVRYARQRRAAKQ